LGVFGVLFGAMISKCAGQLLSVGLTDLRGALHLGPDNASWLGTAFNAAMMFMGPLSVYLGALFGVRRVLLACGALFTFIVSVRPNAWLTSFWPTRQE
jgi:DHA2 family multidrug resistance protein